MASTTAGLMSSAGAVPAERTTTRSPAWWASRAAAIWERPALWTQTNRTSGAVGRVSHRGSPMVGGVGVEEPDQPEGDHGADELHER